MTEHITLPDDQRWVPGYEGDYAVTRTGRVWSYVRGAPRPLAQNKFGQINLANKCYVVDRLVYQVYVGPIPPAHAVVKESDGGLTAVPMSNLRKRKLTQDQVIAARRDAAQGIRISDSAKTLGVSYSSLRAAVRGRTWAHITNPPPVAPTTRVSN